MSGPREVMWRSEARKEMLSRDLLQELVTTGELFVVRDLCCQVTDVITRLGQDPTLRLRRKQRHQKQGHKKELSNGPQPARDPESHGVRVWPTCGSSD